MAARAVASASPAHSRDPERVQDDPAARRGLLECRGPLAPILLAATARSSTLRILSHRSAADRLRFLPVSSSHPVRPSAETACTDLPHSGGPGGHHATTAGWGLACRGGYAGGWRGQGPSDLSGSLRPAGSLPPLPWGSGWHEQQRRSEGAPRRDQAPHGPTGGSLGALDVHEVARDVDAEPRRASVGEERHVGPRREHETESRLVDPPWRR